MSKIDVELFNDPKYVETLKLYEKTISEERGVSCEEQEDRLFSGIEDKKRLLIELRFVKSKIDKNPELYLKYNDFYKEAFERYRLVSFTSSVVPEVKEMIVLLDIACGMKVHFYSVIPQLLEILGKEDLNEESRTLGKV